MSKPVRPERPGKTPKEPKQAPPAKPQRLTRQQQRFIEILANDPSAKQGAAAREAGYSEKSADAIASQLLNQPEYQHVQDALAALTAKRLEQFGVTPAKVLQHLAFIAFGDRRTVGSWGPDGFVPVDSDELFAEEAALVAGFAFEDTKYGARVKVKWESRVEALKLLGKHLKLFIDKQEVTLDLTGANDEILSVLQTLGGNLVEGEKLRKELGLP